MKVNKMTEFLCREITADVIGIYLSVYRASCAYRREHEPPKLAGELMEALAKRGRETLEIAQPRRRKAFAQNRMVQSVFLVNDQVLVQVLKVVHLNYREYDALEQLFCNSTCVVALALNFGSRTPEFWRTQQSDTAPKGRQV